MPASLEHYSWEWQPCGDEGRTEQLFEFLVDGYIAFVTVKGKGKGKGKGGESSPFQSTSCYKERANCRICVWYGKKVRGKVRVKSRNKLRNTNQNSHLERTDQIPFLGYTWRRHIWKGLQLRTAEWSNQPNRRGNSSTLNHLVHTLRTEEMLGTTCHVAFFFNG